MQLHLTPVSVTLGRALAGHLKGIHADLNSLKMYPWLQTHLVLSWFKVENSGQATQAPALIKKFGLQTHFWVVSSNCWFVPHEMQVLLNMNWPAIVHTHFWVVMLKVELTGHCGMT